MTQPLQRALVQRRPWPVALTVVFGLGVTIAAFLGVRAADRDRLAFHFDRTAVNLERVGRQRLQNELDVLYSLRDAFDAEGLLTRQAFGVFARAQLERHPGIRALEWVPEVPASARAAMEAAARRDGLAGFRFTDRTPQGALVTAPPRAVLYPVFYVEPVAGNEAALGFAPLMRERDEAIARARDTGRPAASQAFTIVQASHGGLGVAVFVPVYDPGATLASPADRRKHLRGLVEGLFQPAELLKPLQAEARALGVEVVLADESAPPGNRLLVGDPEPRSTFHHEATIDMGTRRWMLAFALADEHVLAGLRGLEWLVLVAGLASTALIGGYLWSMLARRASAEQLVAERTRALDYAQALDQMKTNFVNGVAHDLRTPLTSILGYAEFLEEDLAHASSPDQHGYIVQIMRGARRLERLMDDLLDLAQVDAGTFRLKRLPADLGQHVQEVAESMRPQLEEAGLHLDAPRLATPIMLDIDADRIERVLANLLSNAIKFAPRGTSIRLGIVVEAGQVRCEVADRGPGIPADELPRLFKRFSQLAGAAAKGGTGLGLSIAKAIVEAHGGQIGVTSSPGHGATFWFSLPDGR
ncbi:MAG: sensor hybrid histidine kinase [Cyanobacteria bacterium RYN_339]|nr:sensor hybrid histidine kinase [Cyanobacteria bacterium RYN_339]